MCGHRKAWEGGGLDRGNPFLRKADATLGPWLLRLVGFARRFLSQRPVAAPSLPKVIGVIKAAALGDTILLSAVISDLKTAFPNSKVILFVGTSNAALARQLLAVDEVVVLPIRNPWTAVKLLRRPACDWMIDTDSWPRISALWAVLSGALWVVGFRTKGQKRHFAFDQCVDHDPQLHEIENYRQLLRALNIPVGSPPQNPRSWLPADLVSFAQGQNFLRTQVKYPTAIAFHFWPGGTRANLKQWPLKDWQSLIEYLAQDSRCCFVLTGGPEDVEKIDQFLKTVPAALKDRCISMGGAKLSQSLQVLSQCTALISVNTGILHLAAALQIPVLGLHGATNPKRWGPVGEQHVSVVSRHSLAACLNLGFEYPAGDPDLMQELKLEQVIEGWHKLVLKNSIDWRGHL